MRKERVRPRYGRKESGSVIVLTAMMASVLFGVMGMAIEVAGFYSLKRKMQTAADAGAKSGAIEIYKASGNWDVEARRGATQNGYTGGVDGVTVTVNSPPSARADVAFRTNKYVEVIVQQTQTLHLMAILTHKGTTTVTAWAVGGLVLSPFLSLSSVPPPNRRPQKPFFLLLWSCAAGAFSAPAPVGGGT